MVLLSIVASKMITGVGVNATATFAMIRAGITGIVETRFIYLGGVFDWLPSFTRSEVALRNKLEAQNV